MGAVDFVIGCSILYYNLKTSEISKIFIFLYIFYLFIFIFLHLQLVKDLHL